MPNYRKKKQSNNRNKNKNKSQTQISNKTTSSSVKQELVHSKFESVGIEPNSPADVNYSQSIDNTTTTSASVLDIGKGVVVDDSSPASNEEINENACNVDVDTCSSDTKTVLTQSNYSSSFCSSSSSSSKKLTEIESNSEGTVFDGDSTFGNSVITDTFQTGTGINSLKTGSANTKDAAVPTAVRSATKPIENTRKSEEKKFHENRTNSEGIRHETELVAGSEDRAAKVIVHEVLKDSSRLDDQSIPSEVIGPKTPQTITSKVIIHQVSKEEAPKVAASDEKPGSKVIVQRVEELETSSHIASKKNADQPPKVITQKVTKKKAVRTVTSSLNTSRSIEDDDIQPISPIQQPEQSSKVIVHQISKEDSAEPNTSRRVSFDLVAQEISKVIIHQISKEEEDTPEVCQKEVSNVSIEANIPKGESAVSKEKSSPALPTLPVDETVKLITPEGGQEKSTVSETTAKDNHSSKTIVDQISIEESTVPISAATETVQVIYQPIVEEADTKTSSTQPTSSSTLSGDTPHQNPLESLFQEELPVSIPKETFIPILVEDSTQTSPSHFPISATTNQPNDEDNLQSTVVFEQISRDRSTPIEEDNSDPIVHPILHNGLTQIESPSKQTPEQENEPPTPPPRTAFPVCRSPKVIVHQIHREGSPRPVFPFTPKSLEKLDDSSKNLACQILKDVSSELQTSFRAERESQITQEVKEEPVRTSFPLSTKKTGPVKAGFFETSPFLSESNPVTSKVVAYHISEESKVKSEPKVITNQIRSDKSKPSHTGFPWPTQHSFPLTVQDEINETTTLNSSVNSKVIEHQILKEQSNLNESITSLGLLPGAQDQSTTSGPISGVEKVIVHQISQENPESFPGTSKEESATSDSSASEVVVKHTSSKESTSKSSSTTTSSREDQTVHFDSSTESSLADCEPKVITHQISYEKAFPATTQKDNEKSNSNESESSFTSSSFEPERVDRRILSDSGTFEQDIVAQPTSSSPESKVILHQRKEESSTSATKSSFSSSSFEPERIDRRILSDSGNIQPEVITQPISSSFPVESSQGFPQAVPNKWNDSAPPNDPKSKVIVHQISRETTDSSGNKSSFTSSSFEPERVDQRINSDSGDFEQEIVTERTPESIVILQQISKEKTSSSETKSSFSSSSFEPERIDRRILSDAGSLEPEVDIHPTRSIFPVSSPQGFPLSVPNKWNDTPPSDDPTPKVIVHQISREIIDSNGDKSLFTSSSFEPERVDRRILSDSGDFEQEIAAQQTPESIAILQQISREKTISSETKSSFSSSSFEPERIDRRILSDSGNLQSEVITHPTPSSFPVGPAQGFPLSAPNKWNDPAPPTDPKSKVIVHQISREDPIGNKLSFTSSSFEPERVDRRIFSDSGDFEHEIVTQQTPSSFPVNASHSFPLSRPKQWHDPIFPGNAADSQVIVHQISKEKSTSNESRSSFSSSSFEPERIDRRILSDSGNVEPKAITQTSSDFPVNPLHGFPLSVHKQWHDTHPSINSSGPKVIIHQISREESNSSELRSQSTSSSTVPEGNDQQVHSDTRGGFPVLSASSFPILTENISTKSTQSSLDEEKQDLPPGSPYILPPSSAEKKDQSTQFDSTSQTNQKEPTEPQPKTTSANDNGDQPTAVINNPATSSSILAEIEESILREESKLRSIISTLTSTDKKSQGAIPKSSTDSKPRAIVHPISKEEPSPSPTSSDLASKSIDRQTSQDGSVSSSSSSGESVLTAIQSKSPQPLSPEIVDQDQNKKSPRSSFFITSAEMSSQTKSDKSDSSDTETLRGGSETQSEREEESSPSPEPQSANVIVHQLSLENPTIAPPPKVISPKTAEPPIVREKSPPQTGKTIFHPIVREIATDRPLAYRVESPQPDRRQTIVKKSKSFDDDDIVIQEMSDNSSAGDTDNPPLVSEAESETDTLEAIDDFPDTPINSRVLSVQTLPIDHEDDSTTPMSPKSTQEYKARRQQNRAALESHFLPQFLSPIFLDSIKEENSDLSDSERRSECSDRTDHALQQGDLEDDVFIEGGPHAKKADAVFPKSNLDFSKPHKHVHTNVRPPKTSVIREEAPPPSVVEAKIIDQGSSIDEFCSLAVADLTPQSEDAEVVYIDSASSSVSDLLELDYSEGQSDDTIDVRIQTPTIDLESVNEMFAYHPSESNEQPKSKSPPPSTILPPVKEEKENVFEKILSPPLTANTLPSSVEKTTKIQTAVEQKIPHDEIILEKIETMSETVAAATSTDRNNDDDDVGSTVAAAAADRVQNSKANNPNSCDSAINEVVTKNDIPVAVGNIENMENLREIVSAAAIQSELDTITDTDRDIIKPNFKIGEPCSDHTFKCDTRSTTTTTSSSSSSSTTTTTTNNNTSSSTTSTTTTSCGTQILTLHDLSKTPGDTKHLHPLGVSSSALDRQESLDSHGSDQSQSTTQSQCTAINQGSLPHCDWNEFDTNTDTTYVSGSDTAGLASSENSSPLTTGGGGRSGDDTESPPIRKLRSLCTEALSSLPYGDQVLEELATVAQNISDMPYPLPDIPHIQDIQVSLRNDPQKSSVITLAQVPPTSTPSGQKLRSPPPPPVPEPPSKYDSWLGVPTESDPNVLVCLSPSQRTAVKNDSTADSLLDMHKKFVERRGYHEYTTKQVTAMNREKSNETVKLSKSTSPPPPPLPPRPQQQSSKPNGNETSTETDINFDDQNNHRLLAIIRDTHENQQQQHQEQRSENISRRTESSTTNSTTNTTTNVGGVSDQAKFANSPSVSKQTQEQRFVSESNQSHSAQHEMQTSTGPTERTIKIEREPILGLKFPTSDYFDSIFDDKTKRFSNIETASSPGFCSQILNTQPKRYSNIETSSFESRKCIENGKVLYDVSDSNRSTVCEGEKPESGVHTSFPELKQTQANGSTNFPYISSATPQVDRPQTGSNSETIMSAFKLNTAPPPTPTPPAPAQRVESSPPAPPVPPLPPTLIDTTATTTTTKSTSSSINRNFNGETKETIFDDFRQHAKEAAAGEQSTKKKTDVFDHEKLFKDFDELSNLLKDELESGKRRPPATFEIPSSVSDYNRVARESKIQTSSSTTTSESTRREQMKKLADEIDRTAAQRQQHRKEMRIPIRIEKPTPTPPRSAPVQMENGSQTPRSFDIPVHIENGSDKQRQTLQHQRSYDIPIRVEHQTSSRQRTRSEHQSEQRSHEAPVRVERPPEQTERFRRAESMFNISDSTSSRHMLHDDWMKYVGDLGSSENICKPFQREVEICYLGRRPNIRAPRLSASTSDLSSTHSYDTYGAYDVRRTTTTQTPRPQQPPRRRFLSTQSMIDTTPITPCVSSRRSPVPERRSSLPREIHDQQLKYISSKEHQLQVEFERLENERRALIDEMNRAQINQRINREAYRQRQLPPLTEDESIRQQMAEEWLNKVAEREERRLQKIIKISKVNADGNYPAAPPRRVSSSDIGDEFLRRVKERRSKLHMPSDSDWESGAESQPAPRTDGSRSENDEPPATVLEGHSEADYKHLPKHLREFAKLTSQVKEQHHEETTENTTCSAIKKSSVVTTVKTHNNNNNNNNYQQQKAAQESSDSLQQDGESNVERSPSPTTSNALSLGRKRIVGVMAVVGLSVGWTVLRTLINK